ncbi:hypothetical protein T12_12580 [Trichinella patagoniensis]|uniref:Uncharacterized protein n=1 Tax=Trichinella patagoniensis TaxID=990121 RepID=A0A0V0Z9J4_9BILA|nr:hypothetical protein T12_12580 [Trichinella patagoniensis]
MPVITGMNSERYLYTIYSKSAYYWLNNAIVEAGAEVERKRLSQNSLLLDDDLEQKLAYTVAEGLQEK